MAAIIRCSLLRRLTSATSSTLSGSNALICGYNQSCSIVSCGRPQCRFIKTSTKKDDTMAVTLKPPVKPLTKEDFAKPHPENWISYGFKYDDKTEDRYVTNATFFLAITCCVVIGGFVWIYAPDFQMRDWAQREAFLELRRREAAGEELLNPNYVDPATIVLPSDEDLGDREIII